LYAIYKTKPCRGFFRYGTCRRGKYCGYYHDESERRTPESATAPPGFKVPPAMPPHQSLLAQISAPATNSSSVPSACSIGEAPWAASGAGGIFVDSATVPRGLYGIGSTFADESSIYDSINSHGSEFALQSSAVRTHRSPAPTGRKESLAFVSPCCLRSGALQSGSQHSAEIRRKL